MKNIKKENMCMSSKYYTIIIIVIIISLIGGYFIGNNYNYKMSDKSYSTTTENNSVIAESRVNKAIDLVELIGQEEAFRVLSSDFNILEDWYVFVYNKSTGLEVVNPWQLTPGDIRDWVDLDGKPAGVDLYNASEEGNFIEYSFTAPTSGADVKRYKKSYIKLKDGYIYGAGYYLNK